SSSNEAAAVEATPGVSTPPTAPAGNNAAETKERSPAITPPIAPPAAEPKPATATAEKPESKKSEPVVTAKAAEYKGRIEEAIAERGLSGRAKVTAVGDTLVLAGKLRPAEHGALLKFLRDAPADVRVVDHIEYDDTPLPAATGAEEVGHPIPPP